MNSRSDAAAGSVFQRLDGALLLIVAVAFLVRLWGIWNVTTTDEYNEVFEALRIGSGHVNLERWIKRFYLYILAVEYGFYYAAGWALGHFQGPMDFAAKVVRDLDPLFLLGRLTSVLAGTATVGVLYVSGRRFFGRTAGVVAASLLALTAFHVDLSQQAKVDALLGLLVALTILLLLRIATTERPAPRDFAWCGLVMALAVQTKGGAITLFVPFLVVWYLQHERIEAKGASLRAFGLAFLAGMIIGNPPVVLAPAYFVRKILGVVGGVYTTPVNLVPSEILGFLAYPLFWWKYLGPVVSVLTLAALVRTVLRPRREFLILLSFVIVFFVAVGSLSSLVAPYYLIPILPPVFLLIGDACAGADRWLAERIRSAGAIVVIRVGACALLLAVPAAKLYEHDLSLAGPNTREIAGVWIEQNIPPGSRILMDSGKSVNSAAPTIAENRASLERTLAKARGNVAEGRIVHDMVDRNALVYYELLLKTVPPTSYDISSTMFGMEIATIDQYLREGYQYLVISDTMRTSRTGEYAGKHYPLLAAFYGSLDTDPRLEQIARIAPTPRNRGDIYLIYRLRRTSGAP